MYNVSYSKQAQIDLADAIAYIAEKSAKNALEYLLRYEDKIVL